MSSSTLSEPATIRALVTGATSGFGRAIAETLALRGAHVLVSGRDAGRADATARAIVAAGGSAESLVAELDRPDDVRELALNAGDIDILVNNAGVMSYGTTADTADRFDKDMALNVRAPFLLVGALAPAMADRGRGSIINISSGVAARAGEGAALYGATKAALEMLTKNWALEFGPAGVRVNAVAAGPSDTEGSRTSAGHALDGILESFVGTVPLRRIVTPQAVADAVAWLASDQAEFVTGATIRVDGGYAVG
jgi:NAD(P)-dependent dehydrogenase (short-subunit alcohol dehydrogenase family)